MLNRRPVIGVMGSGTQAHETWSVPLGRWIARQGYHLLTGGGGGVMEAVAGAFTSVEQRAGLSIGIIPGRVEDNGYHTPAGYPNPNIELPVYTHLPDSGAKGTGPMSRNPINILSSDVIVALPGGPGTASEIKLARKYGKPLILYGPHKSPSLLHTDEPRILFGYIVEMLASADKPFPPTEP